MNATATPRGRYTHHAEQLAAEVLALLPTAVTHETMPAGEYGVDRPIAYYHAKTADERFDIASAARKSLTAASPIRRGDIIWAETQAGPRRAIVLRVETKFVEASERFVLRFACVMQRANGQWGTKQRSVFPGYIERAYEQLAAQAATKERA